VETVPLLPEEIIEKVDTSDFEDDDEEDCVPSPSTSATGEEPTKPAVPAKVELSEPGAVQLSPPETLPGDPVPPGIARR